jgi:hypothetical protein
VGSDAARPGTISGEKLCELTGLTDRRHRQLALEGYFPPPSVGEYQLRPTLIGMFRYFRDQLHKKEDSLAGERKKYTQARREKIQEETAILRREYVRKSEIGPALRNVSLHQRATLQFKLENELAPGLAGKTTPEILVEVRAAVDAICQIFQEGIREWMEDPAGDQSPGPSAEP